MAAPSARLSFQGDADLAPEDSLRAPALPADRGCERACGACGVVALRVTPRSGRQPAVQHRGLNQLGTGRRERIAQLSRHIDVREPAPVADP
jgi:hypothetical protein